MDGSQGPVEPMGSPMLEQRVATLESDVRDMKATLKDLQKDSVEIKVKLASIEGHLKAMPTTLSLMGILITTWAAGAAFASRSRALNHDLPLAVLRRSRRPSRPPAPRPERPHP